MSKSIEQFIRERSWERPDSYMGPDHNDTIFIYGRSRDSDLMRESNFDALLELLGGESESVEVVRDSHWAAGWIESIRVSIKDKEKIKIALEALYSLEDYPLLDETDYYERENEKLEDDFRYYRDDFMKNAVKALITATDVPAEILEDLKGSKQFQELVYEAFRESADCSGIEDAFVSEDNFIKHFQSSQRYVEQNSTAKAIMGVLS